MLDAGQGVIYVNCFYHSGVPAVGVCKSCMRGLCTDCAVELPQGLACRGRCEADAQAIIDLIHYNIRFRQALRGHLARQRVAMIFAGLFIALMGGFFLWVGLAASNAVSWPLTILGGLIAAYGCYVIFRAIKHRLPD